MKVYPKIGMNNIIQYKEGEIIGPCKTREDIAMLCETQNQNMRGIELGVARGKYSLRIHNYFDHFWCVDKWNDARHGLEEYNSLNKHIKNKNISNITILREDFNSAVKLFEDNFFNFIFLDGYAKDKKQMRHNIDTWFKKLNPGGIFSGHDFQYPGVRQVADEFAFKNNLKLNVTGELHYTNSGRLNTAGPAWWVQT